MQGKTTAVVSLSFSHKLKVVKAEGQKGEEFQLTRNGQVLCCPFTTRHIVSREQTIDLGRRQASLDIHRTVCSSSCPHFTLVPLLDKDKQPNGKTGVVLSCGTGNLIHLDDEPFENVETLVAT